MPAKKKKIVHQKSEVVEDSAELEVVNTQKVEENKDDDVFGDKLDPAEEKMLDRILMVIVVFILAWLGLSILLVLRGYACNEWVRGAFFCAGIS